MNRTGLLSLSLTLLVSGLFSAVVLAAPSAELWPYWQAHNPESTEQLDHSAWGSFIDRYLVAGQDGGPNLLRYAAVTRSDRKGLESYLDALSRVVVTQLNRDEQQAYWINLYNALTVNTVLEHYPVSSIRKIRSGLFSPGPWDLKLIEVEGAELSLNDIEHRILRPIWRDNRIHYAVNCASLGCPNLQADPFTAATTERLLERAARAYINSPRGVSLADGSLTLSSLYDWYRSDFGTTSKKIKEHLQRYADEELSRRLKNHRGKISYAYDWSLNDVAASDE
jgi:hypothetical protein